MSAQAFPTHTLYIQNHELYKTHLGSCICKSHTTIWHKKSLWPRITTLQLYWSTIELMSTTQIRWDNSIFQLTGTSLKLIYFFKTCPFLQQYEGLSQPENKKQLGTGVKTFNRVRATTGERVSTKFSSDSKIAWRSLQPSVTVWIQQWS